MPSRFRPAFVVTVAAVGASLAAAACASTCPKEINSGDPCSGATECKLKEGCGVNGYKCENGKWRAVMTYCNPPGPTPVPTIAPIGPIPTDAGATVGPPAPSEQPR